MPPREADLAGTLIDGRFRILGPQAFPPPAGAWQARDETARRRVLVVIPEPGRLAAGEASDAVTVRLRDLASRTFPSVASVLEGVSLSNGPALVTEMPEGGSLRALLARKGSPLSAVQAKEWATPIAAALDALRAAGLAHGGVDADTVLFDRRGTPSLADFRMAAALRAAGCAPDPPRTDLQQLAATLAWSVLGRDLSADEPLGEALASFPEGCVQALATALAADPAAPHASCAAFLEAWGDGLIFSAPRTAPAPAPPVRPPPEPTAPQASAATLTAPTTRAEEHRESRTADAAEPRGGAPVHDVESLARQLVEEHAPKVQPGAASGRERHAVRVAGPEKSRSLRIAVVALATLAVACAVLVGLEWRTLAGARALRRQGLFVSGLAPDGRLAFTRAQDGATMELVPPSSSRTMAWPRGVAVDVQPLGSDELEMFVRDVGTQAGATRPTAFTPELAAAYCDWAHVRLATEAEARMVGTGGFRCALGVGERMTSHERQLPALGAAPATVQGSSAASAATAVHLPTAPMTPAAGVTAPAVPATRTRPAEPAAPPSLLRMLPAEGAEIVAGFLEIRGTSGAPLAAAHADGRACDLSGSEFTCVTDVAASAPAVVLDLDGPDGGHLERKVAYKAAAPPDARLKKALAAMGIVLAGQDAAGDLAYKRVKDGVIAVSLPPWRPPAPSGAPSSSPPAPRVDALLVDRTPISRKQLQAFLSATRHGPPPPTAGDDPATQVSPADAAAYCRWAGARAPSDAEMAALVAAGDRLGRPVPGDASGTFRCVAAAPPTEAPPDPAELLAQADKLITAGAIVRGSPSAVAVLRQVLSIDPANAGAKSRLATLRGNALAAGHDAEAQERWNDALESYGVVLAIDPRDADATHGKANVQARLDALRQQAAFQAKLAKALAAAQAEPVETRARARYEKFLAVLDTLDPENAEARDGAQGVLDWMVARAREDEARGDLDSLHAALDRVEAALKLDAQAAAALAERDKLQDLIARRERAQTLVFAARRDLQAGSQDAAVDKLKEALGADPANPDATRVLGEIRGSIEQQGDALVGSGRHRAALAAYEHALLVDPTESLRRKRRDEAARVAPDASLPTPLAGRDGGVGGFRRDRDGARLVLVPGGRQDVGAGNRYWPEHRVAFGAFLIDEREVTWRQYRSWAVALDRRMPPGSPASEDEPVVGVGFDDAAAYCAWVGSRLPTEDEWEVAASGPRHLRFPWGTDPRPQGRAAWKGERLTHPVAVGSRPDGASPFGVLDMAGNASEWVADGDAPSDAGFHWIKGGSYLSDVDDLATSWRFAGKDRIGDVGFRCARDAP